MDSVLENNKFMNITPWRNLDCRLVNGKLQVSDSTATSKEC